MKLNKIFCNNEKARYAASRLPSTWPSYLHNKCNISTCCFPNSPQAVGGTHHWQGIWGGQKCEGTYYVSPSTAASVMNFYREQIIRDETKKWKAQKDAEIERQRVVKRQLDEEARKLAAEELSAKYEEKRRNSSDPPAPTYNHALSSSNLARRTIHRRHPTVDVNITTEQQYFQSSTYGLVHCLSLYSSAFDGCFNASDDLNQSPQMPSPTSPRYKSKYSSSQSTY